MSEVFLNSKTPGGTETLPDNGCMEGWDPSPALPHEFPSPASLWSMLSVEGDGVLQGGLGHTSSTWEKHPHRVRGGSPTAAPKFMGSPLTRDVKLGFKAKWHPWAKDGGFYLGSVQKTQE